MTADVRALRPDGRITKTDLIELAQHDDLAQVQIVCHWKDGATTVGWTADINHGQLVFGARQLTLEVDNAVFPHAHHSDDIYT
jgi:hypothetical protein